MPVSRIGFIISNLFRPPRRFTALNTDLLLHDVTKTYLFQTYTIMIKLVAGTILIIFAEVKG